MNELPGSRPFRLTSPMRSEPLRVNAMVRAVFRAPVSLFRWRLGWLLGHRFLLVVHRGRRTGSLHRTVLEVLQFDRATGEAFVISGLGVYSDWYRNIGLDPRVEVEIGRERFPALARSLNELEAVGVLEDYERRNRWLVPVVRFLISRLVGWRYEGTPTQRSQVVRQLPVVSFQPVV